MPQMNVIRELVDDTTYHIYNRGVERRPIFLDDQDYGVFLQRLKMMLADPTMLREEYHNRELIRSFHSEVELRAYCLMPNHFHLLLHQKNAQMLPEFMRTLMTSYVMYFNKRYERSGALFQGKYRARRVDTEAYNMHISRYIHLNPHSLPGGFGKYEYSSFRFLANPKACPPWLDVHKLLDEFDGSFAAYESFVCDDAAHGTFDELDDLYTLD